MHNGKKVVALCTSELQEQFHVKFLNRIIRELQYSGHYVVVFGVNSILYYMDAGDYGDASIFQLMSYKSIDMVIVFSDTIKNAEVITDIVEGAEKAHIPVMSIGKEMQDCYNVVYNTDSAFEGLVRHVIEYHGMREVNFIAGMKGISESDRRLEIYKTVLEDNQILFEEERVGYGDFWEGPTRMVMEEFMREDRVPPEAIICANDSMAVAVTDFLKERGVQVPEEIIVTGIDGIEEGIQHSPGITTAVRDDVNDAKKIIALVNGIMEGKDVPVTTELEYHIRLSQSCGCQEEQLFDRDRLITELNRALAAYRADLQLYREMSEKFFQSKSDTDFQSLMEKYIPDNAFICINDDLQIMDGKENRHTYHENPYTDVMHTIYKRNGEISYSQCMIENMMPEVIKGESADSAVLLFPLHYVDQVVGFLGILRESLVETDLMRIFHFMINFNCSAALRLSSK